MPSSTNGPRLAGKGDARMAETASKRILIIDDASLVRRYYRDALERAGFEVDEALNGVEALEKLLAASRRRRSPRFRPWSSAPKRGLTTSAPPALPAPTSIS